MEIDLISLFPDYFDSPFASSMIARGINNNLLTIRNVNIRDFAFDKHRKVDDRPYSGGPGMVLKPEPLSGAIESVKRPDSLVVFLSPKGRILDNDLCKKLASVDHLVLVCGHYEGFDERVCDLYCDEFVSIGDYILSCGAPAAIVLVDAVSRWIPGFLGNEEGASDDSFSKGLIEHPQYTRPEEFKGRRVPDLLLSGNHKAICKWKKIASIEETKKSRPDLYIKYLIGLAGDKDDCESEVEEQILLEVSSLKQAFNFYKYRIGCEGFLKDTYAVIVFGSFIAKLVEGSSSERGFFCINCKLQNKQLFEVFLNRLLKENKNIKNALVIEFTQSNCLFIDPEGYFWMVKYLNSGKTKEARE